MRTSTEGILSRQKKILKIVSSRQDTSIPLIEEKLGVTSKVAWSDIRILIELGLIEKKKGKINLTNNTALDQRLILQNEAKNAIAGYVLRNYLLKEDSGARVCIFMDAGSTINILFQEMLKNEHIANLNFNIVTNNVSLTNYKYPDNIHLILSGGQYLPQDKVLVGKAVDLFSQYKAKLAIMSSTNISFQGYLGHNYSECLTKQAMMSSSEEIIILSDNSKFDFLGGELISNFYWETQDDRKESSRFLQVKLSDNQYKRIKIITNGNPDGNNQLILNKFFGKKCELTKKEISQCISFAYPNSNK